MSPDRIDRLYPREILLVTRKSRTRWKNTVRNACRADGIFSEASRSQLVGGLSWNV